MLVCDPRRNPLLKEGNKSDKIDAGKLADLLRTGMLRPVDHGEHGLRTLRELARSYQTLSKDLNRVMNRVKALYRGWSIPCAGTQVYAPRYRGEWLGKIEHAGVRRRAELLAQQLDGLQALRRTLRPELLAESRKLQVFNKRHSREDRKKAHESFKHDRKYRCLLQPRGARGDVRISCGIRSYRIAGRIKFGQHLFCGGISSSGCLL